MSRVELPEPFPATPLSGWARVRSRAPAAVLGAGVWILCVLHGWAIWLAMDGWAGLTNGWPFWKHDHPLYYYSAVITKTFLSLNGTTAGYDPAFMSGYAKSAVFPASSTLPELIIAIFGGYRPEITYKAYVLVSASLAPWLILWAGALWRLRPFGQLLAVLLFLVYIWTDWPLNYVVFGMLPYFLAVPLGLVATGAFARYCEGGNWAAWLGSAALCVLVVLVHFTSAMFVAPAALAAYAAALIGRSDGPIRFSKTRHLGVWLIPPLVLLVNAFWWVPGVLLASTKGSSDFAFNHSEEGVFVRLLQIVVESPRIELILCLLGVGGLILMARRDRVMAFSLIAFVAAGFGWGYLAGASKGLDFLQPGRHTFVFYTGLALATGYVIERGFDWLYSLTAFRLDVVLVSASLLLGGWFAGPIVARLAREGARGGAAFLTSRPSPQLLWVHSRIKRHVARGERLLYEESGKNLKGIRDPFDGGRFSGLIPPMLGVEVIGGPYLYAALTTNYTQFGEGKLFGKTDWDRDWFVRHARIYRPSAILCWSPRARSFCLTNPELVQVLEDTGELMIGRVKGFGGSASDGEAEVKASAGMLEVSHARGGVDGTVVLRYHSVPYLRAVPPLALDAVHLEGDPVPFIRFRPPPGPFTIELGFPPGRSDKEAAPKR